MHISMINPPQTIHRVTINGVPVADCWEANEEWGYVVVHARDERGRFIVDRLKSGTKKKRLTGVVKIVDTGIRRDCN